MARLFARSCRPWAVLSALLAAVTLVPAPARACSWGQVIVEASYPRAGAVDVPTNAVLFLYGPGLDVTQELQLLDASGQSIAVEARAAVPSGFDLTPLELLQPNQTYRLLASGSSLPLLEFTTGSGPAAVPESLSAPELDVVQFSYALGTCGVLAGLCVETSAAPDTTLELRVGDEVLAPGSGAPSPLHRAYSQALANDDCVEVRARDVRGHRSEPRTVCGSDIARFEVSGDLQVQYDCDNYLDHARGAAPPAQAAPTPVTPGAGDGPRPENASAPRDVMYVSEGVDPSGLVGSDAVIYEEVPSVRSSRGCALGSRPANTGPRRAGSAWLAFGLALTPLLGAALLGARRRS